MERIKSINDVKGNINLNEVSDIEVFEAYPDTYYSYIEPKSSKFFGLFKETPGIYVFNVVYSSQYVTEEEILDRGKIIINNTVMYLPKVMLSFRGTDEKRSFNFDNIKQANKFVRELTKLLVAEQKWLKLV